jgi:flagellin-like protein
MFNKRGASNIITTVLLILVAIAAILIIARFLLPFLSSSVSNSPDIQIHLSNVEAYYDNITKRGLDASGDYLFIKVQRASDITNITGIKFVFIDQSNQKGTAIMRVVPSSQETVVYNFTGQYAAQPKSVEIVSMGFVNGKEKTSSVSFKLNSFKRQIAFQEQVVNCRNATSNSACFSSSGMPTDPGPGGRHYP